MVVGLLLNSNNRLCSYSEKWRDILISHNIPFRIIDPNASSLLDDLRKCSHLMFRHCQGDTELLLYDSIFNIAQNVFGIKCFPNFEMYWSYENKVKEYYLLKSHNFPVTDTHIFWNHDPAYEFLQKAELPVVAKLPKGAGSSNVVKVENLKDGKRIIEQVFGKGVRLHGLKSKSNLSSLSRLGFYKFLKSRFKRYLADKRILNEDTEYPEWQIQKDAILFQKFMPGNTYDTRVTVIGERAFAFRRFVRKNDFRASGSGNVSTEPGEIDIRCIETAFNISGQMNYYTMAYDFIYDENHNPCINEISYTFVAWYLNSCPGYWDKQLQWHSGYFWPQVLQLEDFLGISL